ncbi:helix-turn-helix domain-containing protein [Lactovum odontotermitis]
MIKNRKLGAVFRQLREMKNLSLSQVVEGICSKSQLSRFENGENDIGAEKLFQLLDAINVTYEEFIYQIRNFDLTDFERLFSEAANYEEKGRFDKIELLRQKELAKAGDIHRFNAYALQSIIAMHGEAENLTEKEISDVVDYLFSILEWSHYEIWIFLATSQQLPYPLCLEFAKEMSNRTLFYRKVPDNRELICHLMRILAFVAIQNHDVENAERFLKGFLELRGDNDWVRLIAAPLIEIRMLKEKGEVEEAKKLWKQLISAYELLGTNPKNLEDLKNEEF